MSWEHGVSEVEHKGKSLHERIRKENLSPSELRKALEKHSAEWKDQVNSIDESIGLAPVHYVCLYQENSSLLLVTLLSYGNADINIRAANGKTALMLAVEARNLSLVKDLVALGADVNMSLNGMSLLKMARNNAVEASDNPVVDGLRSVGVAALVAMGSKVNIGLGGMLALHNAIEPTDHHTTYPKSSHEIFHDPIIDGLKSVGTTALVALGANVNINLERMSPSKMAFHSANEATDDGDCDSNSSHHSLQDPIVEALRSVGATAEIKETIEFHEPEGSSSTTRAHVDDHELAVHFSELNDMLDIKKRAYKLNSRGDVAREVVEAMERVEEYSKKSGCRVLCLDGGGVRGLVQIEMLRQIEQRTGKRIVELFDWIIGTSTGGVVALALVYGESAPGVAMKITQLQKIYFQLKENVFSSTGLLQKGDSKKLESYLQGMLKGRMNSRSHPKVLIPTVRQGPYGIELVFFNNCFEENNDEEVWKVGRYTSAAPLIFTSIDGYLDGGLLANNPTEDALTTIQNYYRKRKMQVPISLVVSLGTGVMPPKPHHTADISTAIWKAPSQFFPFMTVIGEALMSSRADRNTSSRCAEQGITYVRLNPEMEEEIDATETDDKKVMNMLWVVRQYLHSAHMYGQNKMDVILKALL